MTIYVAKTTREAKIWGGGTKTKTQFHSVRAESEAEARKDIDAMMSSDETIIYLCDKKDMSQEDLQAYNNQ